MTVAVGSLVRARGREWVVLPGSSDDLLVVRPLGGLDEETTGLYLPLEKVEPATFPLPDPDKPGDYRSGRLLRDAVRLSVRAGAGPFRSFARIAVEPRPYQLVPLLMALRLDPVRLLIADDVGIGKTIEAALVARELLDRGEARRLAVLCPPHLAEQWHVELHDKFHLDTELVLPGTVARLERPLRLGQSLFDAYPYLVISTDFIKSDRRRDEFVRTCPELVIVDEAHTCAFGQDRRGGRHQRHALVSRLAADRGRHLILVTATPHSGDEGAFRSLLALLDADFARLPDDLAGQEGARWRQRLARHLVQRRRGDIRAYLQTDTPFPERQEAEASYQLHPDYKRLFARVLSYARERVHDPTGGQQRQRVRWWAALALLRALASSPAAAAASLRSRAAVVDAETPEAIDAIGRRTVLDLEDDDGGEAADAVPGSDPGAEGDDQSERRRLLDLARQADALRGDRDQKLAQGARLIQALLDDGFHPIVFCRFIHTAEYVAEHLRAALKGNVEVAAVTGQLPPAERELRVATLATARRRVLVCTDCLSEGINLQEPFDAVVHYDLSWNPTRHEQREGRVDRFGQPRPVVRTLTYYGIDNQVDGIVLDVLIRKHKTIRGSLGISVPVPVDANQVVEAIFEGLLLREQTGGGVAQYLPGFEEFFSPQQQAMDRAWEAAADREQRSRTIFAQAGIRVDEVQRELEAARTATGAGGSVADFTVEALRAHGALVEQNGHLRIDLREAPRALREAVGRVAEPVLHARFEPAVRAGEVYLSRTHPFVAGLASYVLDTALDTLAEGVARRCGAMRTRAVQRRTTLLLVRFRHHLLTRWAGDERPLLAEECLPLAFRGAPEAATWLDDGEAEALLQATPDANIPPDVAANFVRAAIAGAGHLRAHLAAAAERRAQALLEAHRRVRRAAQLAGAREHVIAQPPDVVGVYVYLPAAGGA
jgi:superfamily II DNA or RNA helicase